MASLNIRKVTERPQELEPNAIYLISEGAGLFRIEAVSGDGESVLEQTMTLEDIVVADIIDSTIVGQNVLKAEDETAARAILGAASALSVSDITEDIGNLANLQTTHKNTVVGAINEVRSYGAPQWESISGRPAYIASGTNVIAARSSLGVTTAANGVHTGTTTFQIVQVNNINENVVNLAAGVNIDLTAGSYFYKTITGVTAFTRSNVVASGKVASFTIEITNGGNFTVSWFSGVKWDGGTQPVLTANGVDILAFMTRDSGVTWRGTLIAKDSK